MSTIVEQMRDRCDSLISRLSARDFNSRFCLAVSLSTRSFPEPITHSSNCPEIDCQIDVIRCTKGLAQKAGRVSKTVQHGQVLMSQQRIRWRVRQVCIRVNGCFGSFAGRLAPGATVRARDVFSGRRRQAFHSRRPVRSEERLKPPSRL